MNLIPDNTITGHLYWELRYVRSTISELVRSIEEERLDDYDAACGLTYAIKQLTAVRDALAPIEVVDA